MTPKLTEAQRKFLQACASEGAKRVRRQQWRTAKALERRALVFGDYKGEGGYYVRITDAGRVALRGES